jgi:hypothetical protein
MNSDKLRNLLLGKHLDAVLLGIGMVLIVSNIGYLAIVTGPKNVHSIVQLAPGLCGLFLVFVSMALTEMNSGKKTAKEAAITVVIEMLLLGLFIFISALMGH